MGSLGSLYGSVTRTGTGTDGHHVGAPAVELAVLAVAAVIFEGGPVNGGGREGGTGIFPGVLGKPVDPTGVTSDTPGIISTPGVSDGFGICVGES